MYWLKQFDFDSVKIFWNNFLFGLYGLYWCCLVYNIEIKFRRSCKNKKGFGYWTVSTYSGQLKKHATFISRICEHKTGLNG